MSPFTRFKVPDGETPGGTPCRLPAFVDLLYRANALWGFYEQERDSAGKWHLRWPHLRLRANDDHDVWEPLTPEGDLWLLMNIPPGAETL